MGWFGGEKPKIRQKPLLNPQQKTGGYGGGYGSYGQQTPNLLNRYLAETNPFAQQTQGLLSKYISDQGLEPEIISLPIEETPQIGQDLTNQIQEYVNKSIMSQLGFVIGGKGGIGGGSRW